MQRLILILAILTSSLLKAQDLIIMNNGDEIEAIVVEVGITEVTYHKFDYQDGPSYVVSKEDIFMIKYNNGSKDVFRNQPKEQIQSKTPTGQLYRKGVHIGVHVTPCKAEIKDSYFSSGFGINTGLDIYHYVSNYIGIKTGLTYFQLPTLDNNVTGTLGSIGVPLKFLVTTGRPAGFYFEAGFNFLLPVHSKYSGLGTDENNNPIQVSGSYDTNPAFAGEAVIGINIQPSDVFSLNLGLSVHNSFTGYITSSKFRSQFVGLQIGILFKTSK